MHNESLDVYDVPTFCRRHKLSRAKLYTLWKMGLGPEFMKLVGRRKLITKEAAARWRAQMEGSK